MFFQTHQVLDVEDQQQFTNRWKWYIYNQSWAGPEGTGSVEIPANYQSWTGMNPFAHFYGLMEDVL